MPISRLDLPFPFGPVIAQASPVAMLKVASRTAVTSPYATDRPLTARAGVAAGPGFMGLALAVRRPPGGDGPGAGRWRASPALGCGPAPAARPGGAGARPREHPGRDRKSTRLNSSHGYISYAGFCLKKKKTYSETTGPAARRC